MISEAEGCSTPRKPVAELSIPEVRARLAANRRLRAVLDAEDLQLVARLESHSPRPGEPTCVFPEHELVTHGGHSSREATTMVGRAHTVAAIPALAEVLSAGSTTAGHIDAVTRAIKLAGADSTAFLKHSPALVEAATRLPVGEFAAFARETAKSVISDGGLSTFDRQRRSTYFKMWHDSDGMTQVRGAFDPEKGAVLMGTLTHEVERMFHSGHELSRDLTGKLAPWIEPNEHRAANALVNLVGRAGARRSEVGYSITDRSVTVGLHDEDIPASPRAEIVVHVDLQTLTNGLTSHPVARTLFGSDLPAHTIRRLACEADIIPVVLNGQGVPIDVGRAKRLASANQRRALETIHPTCAIPDCESPYHHCQIHHIEYWESGGRTDLDNMVPLCNRHHHAVHEGGYRLTLDPVTRKVGFEPPG